VKRGAPDRVRGNEEALVAFRNAVALSVILRGRAEMTSGYGGMSPTWSDTFDFHPAQIGVADRIVVLSPALRSLIATDKPQNFSPSPYLPVSGTRIWPDSYLFRTLGVEWTRRYSTPGSDGQFGKSLFRSLEVAYNATAVGAKNQGSIHDYGLQIALWVSAIEILAWPESRYANFDLVLQLLSRADIHPELRKRRYSAKLRKKGRPRKMDALERAYSYLYSARNAFLHGNTVSSAKLFTRSRKGQVAIPRIAATVYRAALVAYLDRRHPQVVSSLADLKARVGELFSSMPYDDALAEAFGIEI